SRKQSSLLVKGDFLGAVSLKKRVIYWNLGYDPNDTPKQLASQGYILWNINGHSTETWIHPNKPIRILTRPDRSAPESEAGIAHHDLLIEGRNYVEDLAAEREQLQRRATWAATQIGTPQYKALYLNYWKDVNDWSSRVQFTRDDIMPDLEKQVD